MRRAKSRAGRPELPSEERKEHTRTDAERRALRQASVPKAVRVELAGDMSEAAMEARIEAMWGSATPSRRGLPRVCRTGAV